MIHSLTTIHLCGCYCISHSVISRVVAWHRINKVAACFKYMTDFFANMFNFILSRRHLRFTATIKILCVLNTILHLSIQEHPQNWRPCYTHRRCVSWWVCVNESSQNTFMIFVGRSVRIKITHKKQIGHNFLFINISFPIRLNYTLSILRFTMLF